MCILGDIIIIIIICVCVCVCVWVFICVCLCVLYKCSEQIRQVFMLGWPRETCILCLFDIAYSICYDQLLDHVYTNYISVLYQWPQPHQFNQYLINNHCYGSNVLSANLYILMKLSNTIFFNKSNMLIGILYWNHSHLPKPDKVYLYVNIDIMYAWNIALQEFVVVVSFSK